jgi:hypothetical protein
MEKIRAKIKTGVRIKTRASAKGMIRMIRTKARDKVGD